MVLFYVAMRTVQWYYFMWPCVLYNGIILCGHVYCTMVSFYVAMCTVQWYHFMWPCVLYNGIILCGHVYCTMVLFDVAMCICIFTVVKALSLPVYEHQVLVKPLT